MLTLIEAGKLVKDELKSGVIEMFAAASDILRVMPWEDIQGNALKYNQEGALPGVAFRGVNESYTESTGVINPMVEALHICGGDLDVDNFILQTQGPTARATHVGMKIKALAHAWTTKFVKGDSSSDPREFDGLQVRVTGAQKIAAGSTSGGDALSLAKLEETIDAVDEPTHLFMSKAMRRLLNAAARTPTVSGNITYAPDEFGRRVTHYNGIPILVPYSSNGGTEPLAFDEANPGGGSAVGTSIYVLSLGAGRMNGIQNGGIDARDLGELQTKPAKRTRVEWYPGLAVYHGRAVARLWGIKSAPVVA